MNRLLERQGLKEGRVCLPTPEDSTVSTVRLPCFVRHWRLRRVDTAVDVTVAVHHAWQARWPASTPDIKAGARPREAADTAAQRKGTVAAYICVHGQEHTTAPHATCHRTIRCGHMPISNAAAPGHYALCLCCCRNGTPPFMGTTSCTGPLSKHTKPVWCALRPKGAQWEGAAIAEASGLYCTGTFNLLSFQWTPQQAAWLHTTPVNQWVPSGLSLPGQNQSIKVRATGRARVINAQPPWRMDLTLDRGGMERGSEGTGRISQIRVGPQQGADNHPGPWQGTRRGQCMR